MAGHSGTYPRKPEQVLADIKRGKFAPVYILFGADSAAADELLRALKAALVQPGMEAFDLETVDAVDLDAGCQRMIRAHQPAGERQPVRRLCNGLPRRDGPCLRRQDLSTPRQRNRPALYSFLQCFAVDEFEHQTLGTVGFFQPVNVSDVGVIQRRKDFRFALESCDAIAIALRLDAPIYVNEALLSGDGEDDAPRRVGRDDDSLSAEQLQRRLEHMRPEDFGRFSL